MDVPGEHNQNANCFVLLALNEAKSNLTYGTSFMASFFPEGTILKKSSGGAL